MKRNAKSTLAFLMAGTMLCGTICSATPVVNQPVIAKAATASTMAVSTSYQTRDAFYDLNDSSVNRMTSEHFQIIWGNNDSTGTVNEAFVRGNLENLETIRDFYINVLGMKDPGQSHSPSVFGTGYYKTNIYIAETGLSKVESDWAYMSVDSQDFGYIVMMPGAMRVDEPSWVVPHEYSHVVTYHMGGNVPEGWYEAVANWFRDQYLGSTYYRYGNNVYGPTSDFFQPFILNSDYYFPHLKNWYDAWPILLYVYENPDNLDGLGHDLMLDVLSDTTSDSTMLDRLERLSGIPQEEILGLYSRRMATMDFSRQSHYLNYLNDCLRSSENYNKFYTTLTNSNGWLTVASDRAPMQGGYNVVPLSVDLSAKQVVVNFQGTSTESNADYRVSIVSKTADNTTRYSTMWSNGTNTLNLQGDETAVYLVVCATPSDMKLLEIYNEYATSTRYPYKIQVSTNNTVATVSPSPSASVAPSVSPSPSASATPSVSPSPSASVVPSETPVGQKLVDVAVTTNYSGNVSQSYSLKASTSTAIDISKVTLRYHYTKSNTADQVFWCYAGLSLGCDPWYVNYSDAVKATFGDGYLDITFNDSYTISKDAGSLTLNAGFNNADWSAYDNFAEGPLYVYYDGTLVDVIS